MLTTFIVTLKALIRDRSVLMWAIAFPLVLSTLFVAMFSNLDEMYELDPIPVVIIEDDNFDNAQSFSQTIETLAAQDSEDGKQLIAPTFVPSTEAAIEALTDGNYQGIIQIDSKGVPTFTLDTRYGNDTGDPSQSVMQSVLDRYTQTADLVTNLATENPSLLSDQTLLENLINTSDSTLTERISVTANPPSDSQRYYYAVLAFSTIMMSTFALVAVNMALGNTSPLGARRSLGGLSKTRILIPTLTAAWLLSFACALIGFLYLRLIFNIDFGGKELAVVLTLAVSVLASTFLGALLGTLPIPYGAKSGLVAILSCGLSLFAGLFGPLSQNLGDFVAKELPWLSASNPVRQVSDAFFSLYYYDGYEQLTQCLLHLLVFSLVFFVLSTLILRRQRYASL